MARFNPDNLQAFGASGPRVTPQEEAALRQLTELTAQETGAARQGDPRQMRMDALRQQQRAERRRRRGSTSRADIDAQLEAQGIDPAAIRAQLLAEGVPLDVTDSQFLRTLDNRQEGKGEEDSRDVSRRERAVARGMDEESGANFENYLRSFEDEAVARLFDEGDDDQRKSYDQKRLERQGEYVLPQNRPTAADKAAQAAPTNERRRAAIEQRILNSLGNDPDGEKALYIDAGLEQGGEMSTSGIGAARRNRLNISLSELQAQIDAGRITEQQAAEMLPDAYELIRRQPRNWAEAKSLAQMPDSFFSQARDSRQNRITTNIWENADGNRVASSGDVPPGPDYKIVAQNVPVTEGGRRQIVRNSGFGNSSSLIPQIEAIEAGIAEGRIDPSAPLPGFTESPESRAIRERNGLAVPTIGEQLQKMRRSAFGAEAIAADRAEAAALRAANPATTAPPGTRERLLQEVQELSEAYPVRNEITETLSSLGSVKSGADAALLAPAPSRNAIPVLNRDGQLGG